MSGTATAPKSTQTPASALAHATAEPREAVVRVAPDRIHPCSFQPRKDFSADSLRELADSIREQGILQPLIVRRHPDGFELIAGERRWRAAQLAGLAEVPVLVREADDTAVLELALIENLQRDNLNPIEEAQGYQQLIDQFQLRQEDVAAKVGRSRVSVANALRLLRLAPELQAFLRNGQLSVGHAKAILALDTPETQALAARKVIEQSLNVRQTEGLVARLQPPPTATRPGTPGDLSSRTPPNRDVHVATLERRLEERLATKVRLRYRRGQGSIEIRFFSDVDLERILSGLGVAPD